jgi:hypothetical protein
VWRYGRDLWRARKLPAKAPKNTSSVFCVLLKSFERSSRIFEDLSGGDLSEVSHRGL